VKSDQLAGVGKALSGAFTRSGLANAGARIWRFLRLLGYRFIQDGGLHHTASLTYTTLLSLVPLMTVSLAIFSAFPVSDQVATEVQDFVFKNFVPTSGEVIREHLQNFSTKASRLTGAGTVFLVIVAIMMMGTIDRAFNTIWQVRRKRGALSIFVVYWAILSLGPIFIGLSVVLTSYLVSIPIFADAAETIGIGRAGLLGMMPVLASAVAFTLLYLVVPNRNVPIRHAIAGGLLAAVLFELAKRGFALYITTFPTYQAIYGALAAVPVFLIWIYLSWLVTLLGAEFTYCLGIYRDAWRPEHHGQGLDLLLAYRLLSYLWAAQRDGSAVSMDALMIHERSHSEADLEELLMALDKAHLVLRTERGEWALAKDMDRVTFLDLFRCGPFVLPSQSGQALLSDLPAHPGLGPLLKSLEDGLQERLDLPLSQVFGGGSMGKSSGS
jgi:membrane protein